MALDSNQTLAAVAGAQFGVFTREQALEAGFSADAIQRRLGARTWERLHVGVYMHQLAVPTHGSQAMAAVLAAMREAPLAAVSHRSALEMHGLLEPRGGPIDVVVAHNHSPELSGVRLHRSTDLEVRDVMSLGNIAVTTVTRAVIDAARLLAPSLRSMVVDEAIRTGATTTTALATRCLELRRKGRSGPTPVLELLSERPPGADGMDSCLEILLARHLGAPQSAGWVHHLVVEVPGTNRRWEIDFAFPAEMVAVECDGRTHSRFTQRQRDERRDADLAILGWETLRFTWTDVVRHPDRTLRQIADLLASRRCPRAAGGTV